MKQFIAPIVVIAGILAGGAAGHFLKAGPAASSHDAAAGSGHESKEAQKDAAEDTHATSKEDGHKKEKKKEDKSAGAHGSEGDHGGAADGASIFFKFSREFIVPLMKDGQVDALIIININLEAEPELSQTLFSLEPKLRDNIMTTLIGLKQ